MSLHMQDFLEVFKRKDCNLLLTKLIKRQYMSNLICILCLSKEKEYNEKNGYDFKSSWVSNE